MKSKVFAFPVFTFGMSLTQRIFWILWISLKGSQNLYKCSVQDILAFSQVGWYVDPFQIGGIFHNGRKSHWRAQISRRRLCAEPGFPSRATALSRICSTFLFISEVGVAELCKRQVLQIFPLNMKY